MYTGNVLLLIKNYVLDGFVKVIYSEKVTKFSTVDLTITNMSYIFNAFNCASRAHYLSCEIAQNFDAAFFKELNLQKPGVDKVGHPVPT